MIPRINKKLVERTEEEIPVTQVVATVLPSTPFQTMYNAQSFRNDIDMETKEGVAGARLSYGEFNDGVSETIPDQALTIAEIMYRFARGLPLGGGRDAEYDPEDDEDLILPPNWNKMDISERMDFLAEKRDEIQEIGGRYNEYRNKLHNEEREKEIEKRVNEKLQARTKNLQDRQNSGEKPDPNQKELFTE